MSKKAGRIKTVTVHVKPTVEKRKGKRIHRKGYAYKRKMIVFDGGFDDLVKKVVEENKGKINPRTGKKYTNAELVQYGKNVAADVYRRKVAKYKR